MKYNKDTRFEMSPKCEAKEYYELHTSLVVPTKLHIPVEKFQSTMQKYTSYFRDWSNNREDMLGIRTGLPLVNLTGKYDLEDDITIGPLDYYNKNNPDNGYNETDIIVPTAILYEECFNDLKVLHPYLIRTCILKWYKGANFMPHCDIGLPTPHFRLWGTDNPDSIKLRYKNKAGKFQAVENIEAGRVYIIDTAAEHDAHCYNTTGYQFFIAARFESYETLMDIRDV